MKRGRSFHPAFYQIMANRKGAIGLDAKKRMICVVDDRFNSYYLKRKDIHKVEIVYNKNVYLSKSFFNSWSSYFLARAFTKDKSISETAAQMTRHNVSENNHKIQLKISTFDLTHPNHILDFLIHGTTSNKNKMMKVVYDWCTRIETL